MKSFFGIVVALILLSVVMTTVYYQTDELVTFTVTGKERIVEASGSGESSTVSSKYLVFTESETFENTDMRFVGKFNSSDVQGKLIEGGTYTATVYGWRIPWMSLYRNLDNDVTAVVVEEPTL